MQYKQDLQLFISGKWRDGKDERTQTVLDPATDKEIAAFHFAGQADVDEALDTATSAFASWKRSMPRDRAAILRKAAQITRERMDELAFILTLEQGKTIAQSQGEIEAVIEAYETLAEECVRISGSIVAPYDSNETVKIVYEPVGPVLAVSPWNYPHMTPGVKIATAIAAGNSVILKASEETPASAISVVRIFLEAGLPGDVLQLVMGDPAEISSRCISSPVIRVVSFTGSVPVGKLLMRQASAGLKRIALELGGHAPVVICSDIDVDRVAGRCALAKFKNAGQICVSPTRFYVHNSIKDRFAEVFAKTAEKLVVGHGLDHGTEMGPLANARRLASVEHMQQDAIERGASLLTGGGRIGDTGNFWAPTVLLDVPDDAVLMNEEPFGPLAPIVGWDDLDEVMERANGLPFGLSAYGFTASLERATEISERLQAGIVSINSFALGTMQTPFGGYKESGIGRENGRFGLQDMLEVKTITLTAAE